MTLTVSFIYIILLSHQFCRFCHFIFRARKTAIGRTSLIPPNVVHRVRVEAKTQWKFSRSRNGGIWCTECTLRNSGTAFFHAHRRRWMQWGRCHSRPNICPKTRSFLAALSGCYDAIADILFLLERIRSARRPSARPSAPLKVTHKWAPDVLCALVWE